MKQPKKIVRISVKPDGTVVFIYDDELIPLMDMGRPATRRVSHVEPELGGWTADLKMVGGGTLGPYRRRSDAIKAEINWLIQEFL